MAKNAIFIDKLTGLWTHGIVYSEADMPPAEAIPPGCILYTFDETTPNYELLSIMLLGTNPEEAKKYSPPFNGGLKYNFANNTVSFELAPPIVVPALVRLNRNRLLAECDHLMLVPDMPTDLKAQTQAYRQALRDLPSKVTPDMTLIEHAPWPTIPSHH